jgi:hypothetical protein
MNNQEVNALHLRAVRMLYRTYRYERDEEDAVMLLRTAAEAGHCLAMRDDGLWLGRGRRIKQTDGSGRRTHECSTDIAPEFRGELYRRDKGWCSIRLRGKRQTGKHQLGKETTDEMA